MQKRKRKKHLRRGALVFRVIFSKNQGLVAKRQQILNKEKVLSQRV